MVRTILSAVMLSTTSFVFAKLPALDDAAKAKGAETAARAGWQAKIDAYQLCNVQDKVVAYYRKAAAAKPALDTSAIPVSMATAAAPISGSPGMATAASPAVATPSPVAANPAVAGGTAAKAAGPATPTACADPGPFAYNPAQQTPLETSGAHSPAGNATAPPSVIAPAAAMAPAK